MNLPEKYKWIETIGTLPKLVVAGLSYLGLKEYPGSGSNPVIMQMAKTLQVDNIYSSDDESWCALFLCYLCWLCGKPMQFKQYEVLRAASFLKWGYEVKHGEEMFGDVCVFQRPGGNHVSILLAETATTYIILGGNQSNAVTITEILKGRLVSARRYYATSPIPVSVKKYVKDSNGVVSTNEK